MSTRPRPRRRLPQRVYWVRRLLVLGVAALLVLGITRLLSLGGGDGGGAAVTMGSQAGTTSTPAAPTSASSPTAPFSVAPVLPTGKPGKRGKAVLAQPQGPCDPSDVLVTPQVTDARVAAPVRIVLEVSSLQSPACTFEVSPRTTVVRLLPAGEGEPLWTSQQCPHVVPERTVVARPTTPGRVAVLWNGRASDAECSDLTDWVFPGTYTAQAIAVGSARATASEFVLGPAARPTVTRTPTPTAKPTAGPTD